MPKASAEPGAVIREHPSEGKIRDMSTLAFKVQADRIKSSGEAAEAPDAPVWIAVKISAGFDSPPAAPAAEDVAALIPWRWRPLNTPQPFDLLTGGWDPHAPDAWVIWSIDGAGILSEIAPARIAAVSRPVARPSLRAALDTAIEGITTRPDGLVRDSSLAFNPPEQLTDPAGTLPGFIERLATLPDPVPRAASVHALLAIMPAGDNAEFETLRFIAAPRLDWGAAGRFDPAGTAPVSIADLAPLEAWGVGGADCRAQMVSTLRKSDMVAAPGAGRIIDLFEQTIAVTGGEDAYRTTLPTAEAVAELPQRLADAIDPLARVRSVLPRAVEAWLTPADEVEAAKRLAALQADFHREAGLEPPLRLKQALDRIAIQILGQRYDLVGRFEVPMMEALAAEEGAAAQALFAQHHAAMPLLADRETVPALRIDPTDIEALQIDGKALTLASLSPFSEAYLLHALALADAGSPADAPAEDEIIRRLWTATRDAPAAQPNRRPGLRYFEFRPDIQLGGQLQLQVEWRPAPVPPRAPFAPGTQDAAEASNLFAQTSFERARASAALSYAAPFIEGIVAGRTNWYGPVAGGPDDRSLSQRFEEAITALLWDDAATPGLYRTLATLMPAADPDDVLPGLLKEILEMGAVEAAGIGRKLAFRSDPFDRITPLPLPMALQIDQLHTFPRATDAWARLAGYGLLATRKGHERPDGSIEEVHASDFVSLNPARLYIGGPSQTPSPFDTGAVQQGTLIMGALTGGAERDFVDPLPYSPGDGVGISDAVAEFANSWATAPMPGHPLVDQPGLETGVAAARIVAGPPPLPTAEVADPRRAQIDRIPAFSFGWSYEVLGHLVAQGGVLAPFLRDPANPYLFAETITVAEDMPRARLANYERTTGIGTPTISHNFPVPASAIELIAGELPKRTPPLRIPESGLRINYDHDSGGTLVDWPEGKGPGLRFEFITTNATQAETPLTVTLADERGLIGTFSLPLAPSEPALVERWWRLDILPSGHVTASYQDLQVLAEEQLRGDFEERWQPQALDFVPGPNPAGGEEGAYLTLAGDATTSVEPVRVVPLIGLGTPEGPVEVPGSSATRRAKTNASDPVLLDGLPIAKSNRLVGRQLTVRISGPSIDRHTWERWTNSALFARPKGHPLRTRIAILLGELQAKAAPADGRGGDELPDPAVTALWLELWEIFPRRAMIGDPICFERTVLERPEITAHLKVADTDTAAFAMSNSGTADAQLRPGRIYELRSRAAIKAGDMPFDALRPNAKRLGKAVIESCTVARDATNEWLLGQAAVLTVEVAADIWPNFDAVDTDVLRAAERIGSRAIDLVLPANKFGGDIRQTLRYSVSAGLVPQRWSWRGTPRAPGPDEAFADRDPKDVGRLESGPLRAAHALAAAGFPIKGNKPLPAIVRRDLDWRGGWNLWRFQLRLTSRYAPLFRLEDAAHKEFGGSKGWIAHQEHDADNGRVVTRPPLALVLPLTEADDAAPSHVPPLLALFYGPMHVNGHFGDGLSIAVDVARHPAPDFTAPRDPIGGEPYARNRLKYLPEIGPDGMRTGAGHSGVAVPIKLEGPIGYSFDRDRAVGLFNNSGFLVTPMTRRVAPWSMIKLKFRRTESPEGLDHQFTHVPGADIAIAGTARAADGRSIRHEGIVLQWDELRIIDGYVKVAIAPNPADNGTPKSGQWLKLHCTSDGHRMTLRAWSLQVGDPDENHSAWACPGQDPNAGWVALDIPNGGTVDLRLIVSASPKPTEGALWRPAGEVAVEARLKDDIGTIIHGWQALFSLPIEALAKTVAIEQDARITLHQEQMPGGLRILPVRLSDYSASVWSQFTVPSSHFRVKGKPDQVAVADMKFGRDNSAGWAAIRLQHKDGTPITLLSDVDVPGSGPDAKQPSVNELMFAVLTEPSHDSFNRRGERPLAVVPLVNHADGFGCCGTPIWSADPNNTDPPTQKQGRWRILRVLTRHGKTIGKLEELFAEPVRPDGDDSEPNDATAIVLSVSRPTTWSL
jgi:hypothetical protein